MARTTGFDFDEFIRTVDAQRREQGLRWTELAAVLWDQSAGLNARLGDHPI